MPWPTKWGSDVKAGVFAAVFEHGCSVARATALARAGELPQLKPGDPRPAAAAELPAGTVADWVRHERARRRMEERARAAPASVLSSTVGRLAAVLERETGRIERASQQNRLDPDRVRDLARAGLELERLARAIGKDGGNGSSAPVQTGKDAARAGDAGDAAPASFLDALASETG